MDNTPHIQIFLKGGWWFARHSGQGSERLRMLFGTTDIPAPFHSEHPPGQVVAHLENLNRGVKVSLLERQ